MKEIRVLFVDDEQELVSAVVERLALRGIETVGATGGEEALKMAQEQEFDVVVLDVRMPGLGGFDVIQQLKQKRPELEVILFSGHGSKDAASEGLRLGAFDYLQKPVDIERLVHVIRRAAAK
jgi:DNA-binding NtrC family response regulator